MNIENEMKKINETNIEKNVEKENHTNERRK